MFKAGESETTFTLGDISPNGKKEVVFSFYATRKASQELPISLAIKEERGRYDKNVGAGLALNRVTRKATEVVVQGKDGRRVEITAAGGVSVDIEKDIPKTKMNNPDAVALVMAIKDYSDPNIPAVAYAKRDAQFMREYLVKVLGYAPHNILPKNPDELMTSATMKTYVKNKLSSFLKPDGSSDVFIYYVGHGAPSTTEQASFLVPQDCDPNYVSDENAYRTRDFYNDIARLKARSKTVVIDACFSGQSGDGQSLVKNASPVLIKVKTDLFNAPGTLVFQSSKAEQVSNWYPEKKHSMFTYFFLKGLKGVADSNKDGRITAGELEDYINDANDGLPYWSNREFQRPQKAVLRGDRDKVIRE